MKSRNKRWELCSRGAQIPRIANRELVINMFLSFYKNLLDCYLDHPRAHASPCSSQCSYTPQVILNSCNKEKWLPVIFVSKFCDLPLWVFFIGHWHKCWEWYVWGNPSEKLSWSPLLQPSRWTLVQPLYNVDFIVSSTTNDQLGSLNITQHNITSISQNLHH